MDDQTERALRAELDDVRERLRQTQRELFDCRARLSLIARICQDATRVQRAPGVLLGAVRAVVFSSEPNVQLLQRHYSRR